MRILKTMDKASIQITEEESQQILKAITGGDKFIVLHDAYILVSSISGIYPEDMLKTPDQGRLHDGTRVVKMFGGWKDANNPDLRLDHSYYPEIAQDSVMTEEQFQKRDKKLLK